MKFLSLATFTFVSHDRKFIYEPRSFSSIEEMNEVIIERWNKKVKPDDKVYLLGDVMLNDNEKGLEYASRLNGKIMFLRGNHDTIARTQLLWRLPNWEYGGLALQEKINGHHFYFSHYPTITCSLDNGAPLKQILINIHGHVHSKQRFIYDAPFMYNAAMDAHNCEPVALSEILDDIVVEMNKCYSML